MEEIDAGVEQLLSKFDNEEENLVDWSESVTDKGEVETKGTEEKATQKETKDDTSKESDKSDEKSDDKEGKTKEDADKDIPFHEHPRWKEVMKERKELRKSQKDWEKEKQDLNDRLAKLESKPLTDDELENMTPKEIQEHTRKEFEKENKLKQEISEKEKAEAEKYIDETLSDLRDAGNKFDENKLLKLAEKFTEGDIEKAFDLYQQLDKNKEEGATEEQKTAAKLKAAESNKSNRGSGGKVTGFVSGTSWNDLNLK